MRRLIALSAILIGLGAMPVLAHAEKLAGGEWVLNGHSGKGAPFLRFEAGRVGGSGGCNQFGAGYQQSGDRLSFEPIMSSRMACMGAAMETENAFFDMLGRVQGMKLEGDTLKLLDASGKVIGALTRRMAQ